MVLTGIKYESFWAQLFYIEKPHQKVAATKRGSIHFHAA